MFDLNEYIWLGLFILFLIVEAACPIHLVSIWFSAACLVSMVASLLGAPIWLQIGLFIVVSGTLLACLWPMIKKLINTHVTATNVDSIIGCEGYVTGDVDNMLPSGTVKLGGMEWTARSAGGQNIPKGTLVKVVRIEGVRAFVEPVE